MARLLVTVAYDGHGFIGWQRQAKGLSIMEAIEKGLSKLYQQPIHIVGSGRTDKGVHSLGQCFHVDVPFDIDQDRVVFAMNRLMPDGIRIISVRGVSDSFHARHDCASKTYLYQVNVGPYQLFDRHYIYQFNRPLDVKAMQEGALRMLGTHDFTSLNATEVAKIPYQVRHIYQLDVDQQSDIISFRIRGSGFLRYMVRMMVATLMECGQGHLTAQGVTDILESKDKSLVNYLVPACGLTLLEVEYEKNSR